MLAADWGESKREVIVSVCGLMEVSEMDSSDD